MFDVNERDERDMTIKKEFVTWMDVDHFINSLQDFIKEHEFTGVYGPARGGLLFAVMISHKYGLPFLGAPQKGCLIVDDIVDTGKTAEAWKDKGYTIVSMYYKRNNLVEPDYWMFEKTDNWINFPWEETRSDEDIQKALTTIEKIINNLFYKVDDKDIVDQFKEALNIIKGGYYNE